MVSIRGLGATIAVTTSVAVLACGSVATADPIDTPAALADQERLNLSDPISRYVDGVPSGDVITLDRLGRMRSGLFDYTDDAAVLPRLYAEAPAGPDAFAFTPRRLLDVAFAHPLDFAPGTQYEYSKTNTVLLGQVVENVTGMPLGDYFAQHFFGPLGLSAASYPSDGFMQDPFTHGYTSAPAADGGNRAGCRIRLRRVQRAGVDRTQR